jgi:phosphohistidine phosphatase SixA
MRYLLTGLLFIATGAAAQDGSTSAAIEAARNGGITIVCRHAITDPSHNEREPVDYRNPATQRRLSAEGERQSEAMGHALQALGIPIGEVVASPMQRARRMAELMFGRVSIDSIWHTNGSKYGGPPLEQRRRVLSTPVSGGNRIIISHIGTIASVLPSVEGDLREGDCVVVRPREASFELVGIVPWRAWLDALGSRENLQKNGE